MPEFLAHHGFQSQPYGYFAPNQTVHDIWTQQGFNALPMYITNSPSEYGFDSLNSLNSLNSQMFLMYFTDGKYYMRNQSFSLDEYLISPGVRVVHLPDVEGFTIEEVCQFYYKFTGVRNNLADQTTISFPNNTFESRLTQLQTANIAITDNYGSLVNVSTNTGYDHYPFYNQPINELMLFAKHSGWAWNTAATDETRQWVPNFHKDDPSSVNTNAHNNYGKRAGYSLDNRGYKAEEHEWLGRATYRTNLTAYAYQSDITNGDGVVGNRWRNDDGYGDSYTETITDDLSGFKFDYTHDISLKPFKNSETDAIIFNSGGVPSKYMANQSAFGYWSGYSWNPGGGSTGFTFGLSTMQEFFNRMFYAQTASPYGHQAPDASNTFTFLGGSYIKIPVNYWTTTHNGATVYHRRTGTQGIENVLNLEPIFAS